MIDCPICHVKNNDDARFCLECGQRLGGQAGPSGMPPESAPPRQAQQQPPLSQPQPQQPQPQQPQPQAQPAEPPRQKLRSPMLDDSDDEPMPQSGGGYGAPQQSPGEVNRLRQMSSRQQDPPNANASDRQFKNPYDPRNAPPEAQAPAHPPEQHQRKLRSPLLSGEEFDEEFPDDPAQSGSRSAGGLRSPLLGGGEGGGGGLRSPMLGGGGGGRQQPQYDEYDDEPQGGGGGTLRSPLLGGGGGGGNAYGGSERRRAPDPQFQGKERRSGLRSPILGGGDDEYEGYDEYYDEEPVDEDDPNVLRSPLLSARRPISERPRNEPTPASSNMQNPPRGGQMPDLGPNVQSPSSSYTSLKAIQPTGQPAPQMVPPMPSEPQPQMYTAPSRPSGPPTEVPASFAGGFARGGAQTPPNNPSAPTAQPVRPPEAEPYRPSPVTGGGINIQAPTPTKSVPAYGRAVDDAPKDEPPKGKGRSKMLSGGYDDEDEQDYTPASSRFSPPAQSGPPSPIPKIIGGMAVVLLIMKALAFKDFMGTDWAKVGWLMSDQLVTMVALILLAVLAFTRKD